MQVRVRLFALLRSREGVDAVDVEVEEGSSVADLLGQFFSTRPEVVSLWPHIRVGVSGTLLPRHVDLTALRVEQGAEYALLPPASGGSVARRVVRISPAPLADGLIHELIAEIATPEDGAVVAFVGRTRLSPGTPAPGEEAAAALHAGERVVSLEYEAAEPYASAELARVCDRLLSEGLRGEGGIGVVHAIGSVPVGAISMISVVSSPHRDEAYAVSRALIESIKRDVPIWKAEHYESGRVWNANRDALTKSS
ncbi:MAG: molybdenum cofactor biosynthesis protein MoaE [Candidatus Limnocylindrus sp.]